MSSCKNNEPSRTYSTNIKGKEITIGESFRRKYLDKMPQINEMLKSDFSASIYDSRNLEKNQLVFIIIGGDSYTMIHMLILNENEELINTFEVAGIDCPFAEELEDGSVEWCGDRFSVFENDSTFNLVNKKIKTDSFLKNSKCHIDSTVTTYKINYKAQIEKANEKNYHFERIGIR